MSRFMIHGGGILLVLVAGCGQTTPPPHVESGAEARAREFFNALLHEDWTKAYADLSPESKAWCTKEKFAQLARQHRAQIGFTPTEVHVSASESGDSATAVANFKGMSGTAIKSSKDGTSLQRSGEGWVVVLRKNFGKRASR